MDRSSAGCLSSYCLDNWTKITADPWVLQSVQVHYLELTDTPIQGRTPKKLQLSKQTRTQIDVEVGKLVQKGTVW